MAEWPNAPVLKTGEVYPSAGSNPAVSANYFLGAFAYRRLPVSLPSLNPGEFIGVA